MVKSKACSQWLTLIYRQFLGLKAQGCGFAWGNPLLLLLLSCLGIAFIYSVQSQGTQVKWKMQLIWLVLGCLVYYVVALLNYRIYLQMAHWIYFFSIVCLLLLWTPLGRTMGGSRRWLNMGGLFLQPSDFSKLATLIFTSSLLTRTKLASVKESLRTLIKIFFAGGLPFLLILLQPDLGSSLVLPSIVFALLFVSRLSLKFFTVTLIACIGLAGIVGLDTYGYYKQLKSKEAQTYDQREVQKTSFLKPFLPLKNYQRNRILAFAAPSAIDPQGVHMTWHLNQSLIAIGSGGLFGKGWTKNTQAQLGYLPKAASFNDFIFAVLAEEMGLFGTCLVLILYAILILNTFRIASLAKDRFGCYLAVGVAILLLTHVWINIGMTLGIMPITGIPLPFLSYGGSFMLVCFFSQGIVQSVYRFRYSGL